MTERVKKLMEQFVSEGVSKEKFDSWVNRYPKDQPGVASEIASNDARPEVNNELLRDVRGSVRGKGGKDAKNIATTAMTTNESDSNTDEKILKEENMPPMEEREFGIPEEKKYPLYDAAHVESAAKLFGHVEPKYEEKLAKAIVAHAEKYNVDLSFVQPENKLYNYLPKKFKKEEDVLKEEIERTIFESYDLLEDLGKLSDEQFFSFVDNSSLEDLSIIEEAFLFFEEDADVILTEGFDIRRLWRGKYRDFLDQEAEMGSSTIKNQTAATVKKIQDKYAKDTGDVKKTISKGFLGMGGARAKYIKDAAAKKREELMAAADKAYGDAGSLKQKKGESEQDFIARKLQARLDAQKARDAVKKQSKVLAKQDYKKFESDQKKKIEDITKQASDLEKKELEKRDQSVKNWEDKAKELKRKDWEDTSVAGNIYKFGKNLFKKPSPQPQKPAPASSTQAPAPKPAPQPQKPAPASSTQAPAPKPAPQPQKPAPRPQGSSDAVTSAAIDALKSVVNQPNQRLTGKPGSKMAVPAGGTSQSLQPKVEAPKPEPVVQPEPPKSQLDKFNARAEKTKKMQAVSESYTREELVELFESLELDTHKYTFEYLAERLGFERE